MKHYFPTFAVLALSVMGALAPNVKADETNKLTYITINQPIEVEGAVLPAGSYVLKLAQGTVERNLVMIFNAAQDHVFATLFAIPADRLVPADKSEFKFYEPIQGQPAELHTWFYPGDLTGFEFRVGKGRAGLQLAQTKNGPVSAASTN